LICGGVNPTTITLPITKIYRCSEEQWIQETDCSPNVCVGGTSPSCCTLAWDCSAWGNCIGGYQTRTCVDMGGCGTTFNKPPTKQACSNGFTPPSSSNNNNYIIYVIYGGIIFLVLFVISRIKR